MIAQRFRAVGWAAGLSAAACGLYLINVRVASERTKLEAVERKIAATHRDIRRLQTELGTRASMRQLEKWNGEVLALTTPRAAQYLRAEVQLASLDASMLHDGPGAPPPVMTAALQASAPMPAPVPAAPRTAPVPAPAPKAVQGAKLQYATYAKPEAAPVATKAAAHGQPLFRKVALTVEPAVAKPIRTPAPAKKPVLKAKTLAGIAEIAAKEAKGDKAR